MNGIKPTCGRRCRMTSCATSLIASRGSKTSAAMRHRGPHMERREGDLERLARKQRQNRQQGQQQQRTGAVLLPPPSEPMQVARQFVEECCLYNGARDALTLRYWHGGWWAWRTSHWVEVANRVVRALLYSFTADAHFRTADGLAPWAPTVHKIRDLLEALSVDAMP